MRDQVCVSCQGRFLLEFSWVKLFSFSLFRRECFPPAEHWLCQECLHLMEWLKETCYLCSRSLKEVEHPYIYDYQGHRICYDCQRWLYWEEKMGWGKILTQNISAIAYNEWAQGMLAIYKFSRDERLKYFWASLLIDKMRENIEDLIDKHSIDALTSVPLSENRMVERGFNQSALIAQFVAEKWNIPYHEQLLIRYNDERKQSKKSRKERLNEMLKKFVKNPGSSVDIYNKNILLVDDIYTTGATMYAAAYALKSAGADTIVSVTVAR